MTGHVRRRGERSWEIKFDVGTDPATGKRQTRYHSFKGTKREAEAELTRLKAAADRGEYVDPAKITVAEFLDKWEGWVASQVSPKTLERYKELMHLHVQPHIGAGRLQRLRTVALAELYGKLHRSKEEGGTGLAALTVGHVHRVLHGALDQAVRWSLIVTNPAALAEPPRVEHKEIEIPTPAEIKEILQGLQGDDLYIVAVMGLAAGIRRGEMAALRTSHMDLDRGRIRIQEAAEQTKAGVRIKPPKTKAGRREIPIPPSIVAELRAQLRRLQERRLALGGGRLPNDVFVIPQWDGEVYAPDQLSDDWRKAMKRLKKPHITLHSLRHAHVSHLISAGLDVVTVSKRIGHSSPTVTLNVYAHLFGNTDEKAAAAVEQALAPLLTA